MIALPPGSMANGGGENGERRLPKVDFSSGASYESLNHVIDLFDNQDRHEFDDQMALEVHSMKEHLFTLLGKIQSIDGRLPGANEYLLLSGAARDGTLDLEVQVPRPTPEPPVQPPPLISTDSAPTSGDPSSLTSPVSEQDNVDLLSDDLQSAATISDSSPAPQNEIVSPDSAISELQAQPAEQPEVQQEDPFDYDPDYDKLVLTRGQDFDLDYTLLVPVMRANERQQLDLKGCEPGESTVPIDMMNDPDNHRLWQDSLISEPSGQQRLSSLRVWNWFLKCLDQITQEARIEEKKGKPKILLAVPAGCPKRAFTLILMAGGTRILYDLVPCISFRGWPQVAAPWLQETGKFWQRAGLRHSDAAGAFHLLPGRGRNSTDWRFCFARSEVQLKKLVPQTFMKVFYCWRTVLARALARQKTVLRPYALRAIFFWACDRVQNQYLSREDEIPSFFCGLIDDVLKCLLTRSCPSYFLPHVNLLDKTDDATILSLAQIILMVRSDPVEQIRNALEQVSAARGLTQVHNEQSYGKKRVVSGIDSTGAALYSHVRVNDPALEESQESLADRVKKMVQQNKGSSISVFINPNDVTRAHFRVDEKFT